jgi:FkbM family methyltransferase
MAMLLKKRLLEALRCARHNLLHLKMFQIKFDGERWHVTDREGLHLTFPFYPYLVFFEIEGYLRQGKWSLTEGMTVIDAGACYGEFSLYAARRVGPSGKVLMLEPDPENIRKAEEYFAYNGGKPANLEIVPAGLWKHAGTLKFASGLGSASTLIDAGQEVPPGASITEVPVESLASLVERYGLRRLDQVKVDIEGAEVEVVESGREIIEKFKPRFSIASYHPRDGRMTSELVEPLLRGYGYEVATGFLTHRTTWGAPRL